jgi:hypothetical protein
MSSINKITKRIANNFSIPLLLSLGTLVAMPTPSHAIDLFFCRIYYKQLEYNPDGSKKSEFIIDPENVQSFNLNASFNPEEFAFEEIVYQSPYTQLTPPDFSQLSSGLIQGIAGSTSIPISGSGNLFSLIFTELVPNPQSSIKVFPGLQSFLVTRNSDTGETTTLGPSECPSCEGKVPEPITLFGSAMGLGFGAVLKKQYSRRQKKAKTLEKLKA